MDNILWLAYSLYTTPVQYVTVHFKSESDSFSDSMDIDEQPIWPLDFYACDIEAGFAVSCHHLYNAFCCAFHQNNHRRHWMEEVDANVRDRYIKYGRTSKGLWSSFLQDFHKKRK